MVSRHRFLTPVRHFRHRIGSSLPILAAVYDPFTGVFLVPSVVSALAYTVKCCTDDAGLLTPINAVTLTPADVIKATPEGTADSPDPRWDNSAWEDRSPEGFNFEHIIPASAFSESGFYEIEYEITTANGTFKLTWKGPAV